MIEIQKSVSSRIFLFSLKTCYFLFVDSLYCYKLIKNGTGGTGMETSHFRFVGCLEVQSCLCQTNYKIHPPGACTIKRFPGS